MIEVPLVIIPLTAAHKMSLYVNICAFQLALTCSKLTIETREQGVKYVQS